MELPPQVPGTPWQLLAGLGGTVLTGLISLAAIMLRKKRPKAGAEDAVYEVNRMTIEDQRAQIRIKDDEIAQLRTSRNEFEAAVITTNANLQIATQAAQTAARAAEANAIELVKLRTNWLRALQYIHILQTELARHGLPVPPQQDDTPDE